MLRWGAEHQVNLHFIDPGKPTRATLNNSVHADSMSGKYAALLEEKPDPPRSGHTVALSLLARESMVRYCDAT